MLVDGIAGLNDWLAAPGRGSDVLLAWKAGGAVLIAGRTAAGASVFGPVTACTDALVAQAPRRRRRSDPGGAARGRARRRVPASLGHAELDVRRLAPGARHGDRTARRPRSRGGRREGHRRARGRGRRGSPLRGPHRPGPGRCRPAALQPRAHGRLGPAGRAVQPAGRPSVGGRTDTARRRREQRLVDGVARGRLRAHAAVRQGGRPALAAPGRREGRRRRAGRRRRSGRSLRGVGLRDEAVHRSHPLRRIQPAAHRPRARSRRGAPACGSTPPPRTSPATSTSPSRAAQAATAGSPR